MVRPLRVGRLLVAAVVCCGDGYEEQSHPVDGDIRPPMMKIHPSGRDPTPIATLSADFTGRDWGPLPSA